MSNISREISEAIKKIAGTHLWDKVHMVPCTVTAVNTDAQTCDCIPIGGNATTPLMGVSLAAESNDGFLLIPSVGSTVMVMYSVRNNPFVALFSNISNIIIIGDGTISGNPVIQLQDGSYGGLIEIANLTAKLNNLVSQLQAQLALIATGITGAGGTYTPGELDTFSQSDYENTKITHGI